MCAGFFWLRQELLEEYIHASNTASNERYGGEGLRERFMEQGKKLPLSLPRPQA